MQTSSEKRENKFIQSKINVICVARHHSLFTGVNNTPQSSLDYIVGPITSPQHKQQTMWGGGKEASVCIN